MSRRASIIHEAARLFEEKGFKATSMRDLATHVGIEASSLYSHISSKQQILKEICFHEAELFLGHIEKVQASNISEYEKLHVVANFHIDSAFERITSATVFNNEWMHLNEEDRLQFIGLRDKYEESLKVIITSCMEECSESKDYHVDVILQYFLSSFKWLYTSDKFKMFPKELIQEQLIKLIFQGLIPK